MIESFIIPVLDFIIMFLKLSYIKYFYEIIIIHLLPFATFSVSSLFLMAYDF